jgi:hypothetical protein
MRQLKPGDAMVVLQEFIGVCPCRGFEAASLPILIDERDFRTDPGVPRAHAFADRAVLLGERAFYLWAEFGDRDPTSTLTAANEALDSIELLPSSDRGPGYLAVPLMVEPPVFQPLPGWTTLSSGPFLSGDEDIPVTWATNQPISEVDLACSALAQTLCFPSESLSALAEDGIFIVASLPLPGPPVGAPKFPDQELPPQLSDADVQTSWEGQATPNVPQYVIWAQIDGVDVDLRTYFGTMSPTSDVMGAAQAETNTIMIPA